jgi:hypothetical protein
MIKDEDFQYCIYLDYNNHYSCEDSGCNEEGICRCGEIDNIEIVSVNISDVVNKIYNIYFDGSVSSKRNITIQSIWGITPELIKYAIDRILRVNKIWSPLCWDISVVGGYYGQEIGEVFIINDIASKLEDELEFALNIESKRDLIHYLLKLEYGKILPELEGDFEVITVHRDNIIFRNNKHFNNVIKEDMEYYSDKKYHGIRGIVIQNDDKFRLIDGYHRCSKTENETVRVLLAINLHKSIL